MVVRSGGKVGSVGAKNVVIPVEWSVGVGRAGDGACFFF